MAITSLAMIPLAQPARPGRGPPPRPRRDALDPLREKAATIPVRTFAGDAVASPGANRRRCRTPASGRPDVSAPDGHTQPKRSAHVGPPAAVAFNHATIAEQGSQLSACGGSTARGPSRRARARQRVGVGTSPCRRPAGRRSAAARRWARRARSRERPPSGRRPAHPPRPSRTRAAALDKGASARAQVSDVAASARNAARTARNAAPVDQRAAATTQAAVDCCLRPCAGRPKTRRNRLCGRLERLGQSRRRRHRAVEEPARREHDLAAVEGTVKRMDGLTGDLEGEASRPTAVDRDLGRARCVIVDRRAASSRGSPGTGAKRRIAIKSACSTAVVSQLRSCREDAGGNRRHSRSSSLRQTNRDQPRVREPLQHLEATGVARGSISCARRALLAPSLPRGIERSNIRTTRTRVDPRELRHREVPSRPRRRSRPGGDPSESVTTASDARRSRCPSTRTRARASRAPTDASSGKRPVAGRVLARVQYACSASVTRDPGT